MAADSDARKRMDGAVKMGDVSDTADNDVDGASNPFAHDVDDHHLAVDDDHTPSPRHEPPPLGYTMTAARKRSLVLSVGFIYVFNVVVTTLLFYLTKYLPNPHLDPTVYYGATSAALGILQIPQWPYRYWNLCRENGRRSGLPPTKSNSLSPHSSFFDKLVWVLDRGDGFQWGFFVGIIIGTAVLVVCSSVRGTLGYFPLLVLMPAIIFGYIGLLGIVVSALAHARVRQPLRISDVGRGEVIRPVMYYYVSDLVGCDGGGGYDFRHALDRRYRASPLFRRMIKRLSWFVSISLTLLCVVACVLTYGLRGGGDGTRERYEDASWAANMGLLTVWLALTAWYGVRSARANLRAEREEWARSPPPTSHWTDGNGTATADATDPSSHAITMAASRTNSRASS